MIKICVKNYFPLEDHRFMIPKNRNKKSEIDHSHDKLYECGG